MKLLTPVALGSLHLSNRIIMAPMTRSRASAEHIVGKLTETYYEQRASAGMITTEGICVSPEGVGNPNVPGIWNSAQTEAWKKVTEVVHNKGGIIVAQLWHVGRVGHSSARNGKLPIAPTAIAIKGSQIYTSSGLVDY